MLRLRSARGRYMYDERGGLWEESLEVGTDMI